MVPIQTRQAGSTPGLAIATAPVLPAYTLQYERKELFGVVRSARCDAAMQCLRRAAQDQWTYLQ